MGWLERLVHHRVADRPLYGLVRCLFDQMNGKARDRRFDALEEAVKLEIDDLESRIEAKYYAFSKMAPCPKRHELANEIIHLQYCYKQKSGVFYTPLL